MAGHASSSRPAPVRTGTESRSRRLLAVLAAVVGLSVAVVSTSAASAPSGPATLDTSTALVQLAGDPLSVSPRTRPAQGKKVDFSSASVKATRANLSATRNDFRRWLRTNAPSARITQEFDLALHAVSVELNGASLDTLRSSSLVRTAAYQALYRPTAHDDPDLSLVRANEAWTAAGGEANAGAGVKVAVIDSGIDHTHPCFSDAGYPAQSQLGDTGFTNNKVIAARVYSNRIKQDDLDASPVNSHGTHVAGTVACNAHTPAVVDGVDIPYDPSGVAPRALLGNYNVFPGTTGSARSEDILEAMEDAYEDGFDIANMSLGGARNDGGGAFLLDNAVDNLDLANMVVAIAAGNEGPGYFTVHYPGAAPRALTAGASTVGHGVVNLVNVAGTDYEAVIGDFAEITADVSAPLEVVLDANSEFDHGLDVACDPLAAGSLTGEIALLGRGVCDFTVKMRNAKNAGAIGVIMVDRVEEAPFVMSHNDLEPRPDIPGVMVRLSDGIALKGHDGATATLKALGAYTVSPADTNLMAGFSSWGPTHGDLLIKPDVSAPGADVLSAFPATECSAPPCWSFLGGTSMATPHLAGAAAVVRGIHPGWSAAQVRSAIVNTAQEGVLRNPNTGDVTNDAQIVGSGLLDVEAATSAVAGLDPVSKSFGSIPSASGVTRSASMSLTNLGSVAQTFAVTVADDGTDGVTFAGGGTFTLAPGVTQSFTVMATSTKGVADGHKQARLGVSVGGTNVAHALLYTLVGEGDRAPGQHQLPPPKA